MTVEHTLVSIYHHQGKSENPFVWETLSDCSLCIFSEATITPDTGVEHMTWVKSISHSHSHSDWFWMVKSTRAQKTQLILRFIWKHERNVPGLSVCLSVSLSLSLSLEITERAALVNLRTCRFHYKARLEEVRPKQEKLAKPWWHHMSPGSSHPLSLSCRCSITWSRDVWISYSVTCNGKHSSWNNDHVRTKHKKQMIWAGAGQGYFPDLLANSFFRTLKEMNWI